MPCDSGDSYNDRLEEWKKHQRTTRVACELAEKLTGAQYDELSKEAHEWIEEHRKIDAKRIAEERRQQARDSAKKKALAKLTANEKRALGL